MLQQAAELGEDARAALFGGPARSSFHQTLQSPWSCSSSRVRRRKDLLWVYVEPRSPQRQSD